MSVSKIECVATVRGKGKFTLGFYRHLAPITVAALLGEFPLSARAMLYPGVITLLTNIKTGVEKPRTEFARGDVAFLAANGSVCIFLKNAKSERPLNPVGKVEEGLDMLETARAGDVVQISGAAAQEAAVQT